MDTGPKVSLSEAQEIAYWQGWDIGRARDGSSYHECRFRNGSLQQAWYKGLEDGSKERTGKVWEFPIGLDND